MSNIHNYPLTATQINDEDFYDVDYWNGAAYETRKISGAILKSLLQANIYNADGTLTGNRIFNMDGFGLAIVDQAGTVSLFRVIDSGVGSSYVEIGDNTTTGYQACQINGILVNAGGLHITPVNGFIAQVSSGGFLLDLNIATLLNNRAQTFQDKDGNIALTTDTNKIIASAFGFLLVNAGAATWNGVIVGSTTSSTLNESYAVREFSGVGQARGCYLNTITPSTYPANADIKINLSLTSEAGAGNIRIFVGLQQPNAGNFGDDSTTIWQFVDFSAPGALTYPINNLSSIFSGLTLNPNEPLSIKVFRDPNDAADTFTGKAFLNTVQIEID